MTVAHARIGFRQRVPYTVLERGLHWKLGPVSGVPPGLKVDLRQYYSGENRLAKAATTVNLILNLNEEVIERLRCSITAEAYLKLCESDRKALVTCLLCLAYPIAYDCLVAMSKIFKIQDSVSRDLLHQKMSSLYGSNRSVYIAVGELLPTFIDLGLLTRLKPSVYLKNPPTEILNPAIAELSVYADIALSKSTSILVDDIRFRPWFAWFAINEAEAKFSNFIRFADAAIGRGYLLLK